MNLTIPSSRSLASVADTPAAPLSQSRLSRSTLRDVTASPSPSGIQNQDIYRSVVIGAGIGGVSGAISSLFNPKASLQKGSIIGTAAGALNGAVVGVITQNSASKTDAMLHSALASAGIGVVQNALVGKTDVKGLASGFISGAFRGAVVSYQLSARGEQRIAQQNTQP